MSEMQEQEKNNSLEQDVQTTDVGSIDEHDNDSQTEEQQEIENVESSEQPSELKETKEEIPTWVKEKLGREKKRHTKELRALKDQLAQMQAMFSTKQETQSVANQSEMRDPYTGNPIEPGSVQEEVYKAIQSAMLAKDQQEAKKKEVEKFAVVRQSFDRLHQELEKASDVYEDFDDVVRDDNAPFTPAMRDTAALLENPAEVLYKLGKNREELFRIASLHPLLQAQEMIKLSFDLMKQKKNTSNAPKPITPLKNNPAISSTSRITEKSSVSEIRKYLKGRK